MQPGNLLPNVPTGQVLLKLDFNNPYNRVRMDNVLKSVIQNSPEIFTFMLPHSLSILKILSANGIQQVNDLGT